MMQAARADPVRERADRVASAGGGGSCHRDSLDAMRVGDEGGTAAGYCAAVLGVR